MDQIFTIAIVTKIGQQAIAYKPFIVVLNCGEQSVSRGFDVGGFEGEDLILILLDFCTVLSVWISFSRFFRLRKREIGSSRNVREMEAVDILLAGGYNSLTFWSSPPLAREFTYANWTDEFGSDSAPTSGTRAVCSDWSSSDKFVIG